MAKVQAINGGDVQVKDKSRAKTWVKSHQIQGGANVNLPYLERGATKFSGASF